ncbi:MAG: archaeal proteasome endopeptidase complex subunit alpha [Halobacteriaceae archaeon]
MRRQDQQQAYDRGSAMYSPDGRIYQVEYAHEAVSQGAPSVGVRTAEGVVLAVSRRVRSDLLVGESIEKLHKIDDHVGIATTGHVADGRKLVEYARQRAQLSRLRFEEPITVEELTKALTDEIQQFTQTGGTRPFGVSLLVAGVDDGTPALFEADPSGNPTAWRGRAVGEGASAAQEFIEDRYEEDLSLDDGVALALDALRETGPDTALSPDTVGVATVGVEDGRFTRLSEDAVADYLGD